MDTVDRKVKSLIGNAAAKAYGYQAVDDDEQENDEDEQEDDG